MKHFKKLFGLWNKIVDFLTPKTRCPYCDSEKFKFDKTTRMVVGGFLIEFICEECGKSFSKTESSPDFHQGGSNM